MVIVQERVLPLLGRAALYALLIVLSLLFLLPFIWMISTSLKTDPQVYRVPPIWIPNPMRWLNYPEALTSLPFLSYFINTMKIAVPATIGTLFSSALTAYGFSRIRWPERDALFYVCVATMMIPFQVQMIPLFVTFKTLGWINSYWPLIVPTFFASPFSVFMLRQFFLTIPQELSDAARIDGCSEFGIFVRIILPLAKPALAVVALFTFMWAWSDYLGPLIYVNQVSKFTVALGLQQLRATFHSANQQLVWPYLMAASTTAIVPILFLFFFAQRTFIEGISLTGIKG
jgi:multiple sugar transport system permease protein